MERTSKSWNTLNSPVVSRPAIVITSISVSQPDIHSAAFGFDGVFRIGRLGQGLGQGEDKGKTTGRQGEGKGGGRYGVPRAGLQPAKVPVAACGDPEIGSGSRGSINAKGIAVFCDVFLSVFGGSHHARLAAGRMAETARFFPWCGGRGPRPMGGAGGPDRRRREGGIFA